MTFLGIDIIEWFVFLGLFVAPAVTVSVIELITTRIEKKRKQEAIDEIKRFYFYNK